MKLVQPGPFNVGDSKRFYLPGATLESHCPKCEKKVVHDFGDHYLSYPAANRPISVHLHCASCDHEWYVKMRLDVSLSLLDNGDDGADAWPYGVAAVERDEAECADEDEDEERGDLMKIRIDYDDQPNDVVEKINKALKHVGFEVKDDEGGEGFVVYKLSPVAVTAK